MKSGIFSIDGYDIYLRKITIDDSENIIKWRNNENVKKNFIYQKDFTIESQTEWIKTKINTGEAIQFIIVTKENDKPIGSVYLRDIDRINKKAEYGIFIGNTDKYGKGYGTQAAKLMIEYAFNEEKLHRLYLRVYPENTRAIQSYKNAGFECEGLLKQDAFVNGEYRDMMWMGIVNE